MSVNRSFDEARFEAQLARAVERVRTILDTGRRPQKASEEGHTYGDKYVLAEQMVNAAVASQVGALARSGARLAMASTLLFQLFPLFAADILVCGPACEFHHTRGNLAF